MGMGVNVGGAGVEVCPGVLDGCSVAVGALLAFGVAESIAFGVADGAGVVAAQALRRALEKRIQTQATPIDFFLDAIGVAFWLLLITVD